MQRDRVGADVYAAIYGVRVEVCRGRREGKRMLMSLERGQLGAVASSGL